jgi:hypothetical protein
VTVSGSTGYIVYDVTFPEEYSSPPVVLVSAMNPSITDSQGTAVNPTVLPGDIVLCSVSTGGFKIAIHSRLNGVNVSFSWLAIG